MKLPILKILFVKIICLLGIVFCLPSILSDQLVEKMPRWLKDQQYNLGIDLQGGSQIVLEINFNENIKESTRQLLIEVSALPAKTHSDNLWLKGMSSPSSSHCVVTRWRLSLSSAPRLSMTGIC